MHSPTSEIRKAGVAGLFYPADPLELSGAVDEFLSSAPLAKGPTLSLVCPHAGYMYSGHVAGQAYGLLRGQPISRVVVVAPSHVEVFQGACVFRGDSYRTPLGTTPLDREFRSRLTTETWAAFLGDHGHQAEGQVRCEHSLEVQLPFLQRVLESFRLVPIVMGDQSFRTCRDLAVALAELAGSETLIVASSDLSHHHPYEEAVSLDQRVVEAVRNWDYFNLSRNLSSGDWEACGGGPVVVAMLSAQLRGANRARILRYANSGDVPPYSRHGVVGYLAAAFTQEKETQQETGLPSLSEADRQWLLSVCREAVATASRHGATGSFEPLERAGMEQPCAVFVTLRKEGQLRGCIGSVLARERLPSAVAQAAASAAIHDQRFPCITPDEVPQLSIDISVLSPFRLVRDFQEVTVGRDGLFVEKGGQRGLLLPQVATENGWDSENFLRQTCVKAGLDPDEWQKDEASVFRFSALVFGDRSE